MMQNYSTLHETHEPDEEGDVLVHVAEPSRARWNHIEDLDSFFSRMYQYHQRHGFGCMLIHDVLELIQFIFIIVLTCYVVHGLNYPVLFKDLPPDKMPNVTKITLYDVVYPVGITVSHFGFFTWLLVVIAILAWILKLVKGTYSLIYFWDIKQFYNTALKIADYELDNLTWHEVQTRVKTVQMEQQMCIHKKELTELDIYHRILRQQNYLVAMVNKHLLPARLQVPFIGEVVYWSTGLRFNIRLLFFWSPWSPFEHPWQLREEYKKPSLRHELANRLGKQILLLALINLIFAPLIFLWQVLYAFFSYAALIRKDPAILANRRWSLYGRLYLRHFNELEHELNARLTRAYKPGSKYLASFTSPMGTIVSENMGFYATAILAVFVILSMADEDVLGVEHVITIMTCLTIAVATLRKMAPEETTPADLEELLTKVVMHTHYLPPDWIGQAHTERVRKEFEQLFQYGSATLIETVLSPLLTPYILWRHIYPRSIEIVDFFRNFTVSVVGVGDVCSFAQMDVRRHGNPEWHEEVILPADIPDQYSQCEDGKVELSLVHFKSTNPSWQPPPSVKEFVKNIQNQGSMHSSDAMLFTRQMDESMRDWRVGEEVSGDAIQSRLRVASPIMHTSNMYSQEGPSLVGIREMSINAMNLHNIHGNRTDHRVRNTAQETTPLLIHR